MTSNAGKERIRGRPGLGLQPRLQDGDGIATRVLKALGLDLDQTRAETLRELTSTTA